MAKLPDYIGKEKARDKLRETYGYRLLGMKIPIGDDILIVPTKKQVNNFLWWHMSKLRKHVMHSTDCTYRAISLNGLLTLKWFNPAAFDSRQRGHRAIIMIVKEGVFEVVARSNKHGRIMTLKLEEPNKDRVIYSMER